MTKWFAWISLLVFVTGRALVAQEPAQRVVVIYNESEPESRPLAEYYAEKRGVPTNQLCGIRVRVAETITRQEFNEQIRGPVERFLTRTGLLFQEPVMVQDPAGEMIPWVRTVRSRVSYLVLMFGVPLRVDRDPALSEKIPAELQEQFRRNEASVDSDLTLAPTMGATLTGFQPNPFFATAIPFGAPLNQRMLLVGRLDGPDAATVRRMIDDALMAEQYGLHGRGYFDWQGTKDKGYTEGDAWIRGAYDALRAAGYECEIDERPPVYGLDDLLTDVAVYAGWYSQHCTGPFRRPSFRFMPGAVAYHLHSASGASVRSRDSYWVGPFLDKGAGATMGTVFEPYLQLTPRVDAFFRRLLDGGTFLEAAYVSQPVLSWQTTFVGDPLYRPFAMPVDEQIARLEEAKRSEVAWAYLRKINLLLGAGQPEEALSLCRERAEALGSVVLLEKLGDLLCAERRDDEAVEAYRKAAESRADAYRHIRVTTKLAQLHERREQLVPALELYERLAAEFPENQNVIEFWKKARDLSGRTGDKAKSQSYQARIEKWAAAREAEKVKNN